MDPTITNSSIPQGSTSHKKKRLIIIALVVLLLVVVSLVAITNLRKTNQSPISQNPTSAPSTSQSLTGLEIAKQTALFLDKATKEDGSVIPVYNCTIKYKTC